MVSFRRVEESDPASVMITIFEDEGAVFGDVTGPMQSGGAFSRELTGPIPMTTRSLPRQRWRVATDAKLSSNSLRMPSGTAHGAT